MYKITMNIIVQAGGKGDRLRHHTWNKPKCLVSINGKPIIYHLFEKFLNDNFIIIGDYMFETIETYLNFNNPQINYSLIKANGNGNCSGISEALKQIDNNDGILLIWSDILLNQNIDFTKFNKPTVFTTQSFKCRYGINNNNKIELTENKNGIIGMFYFPNLNLFKVPFEDGEFVDWFSTNYQEFETFELSEVDELGDFTHYENQITVKSHCRFFNNVKLEKDQVVKKCINKDYEHLIENEQNWYKEVSKYNFLRVPQVIDNNPYILSRINGNHPFEFEDLNVREKSSILIDILDNLSSLHTKDEIISKNNDIKDVYIDKTIKRLESVKNLFKFNKYETITINGLKCKNYSFENLYELLKNFETKLHTDHFHPIHGDSTFSNIIIDKYLRSWLIDPRGYFSKKGIWGDPFYDFSKLYYSVFGNYDYFNRKKFKLFMNDSNIEIMIEDNIFKNIRNEIFNDYFSETQLNKIKLIHSLIWLSLTGYVLDDLDSIYASYYLGLYWLEKSLNNH